MEKIDFVQQPEINIGDNFYSDLNILLSKYYLKNVNVILLTGQNSFSETDYYLNLKKILNKVGICIIKEIKVHSNPILNEIESLELSKISTDIIIAVGGGSVIDFGKILKMHYFQNAKIFIIYTLLGSASIVTPFAIFDNNEFKIGVHSEKIIPDIVYINKNIISFVPNVLVTSGSFDILSHIIESFLSKAATDDSRHCALKGLKHIKDYTDSGGTNITSLIKADIFAGLSEKVGLVLFPHAAGHYLTYKYKISHSLATMYFLERFIDLLHFKGVHIPQEMLRQLKLFNSLFIKEHKVNIRLSAKDIKQSYSMVKKYMPFIFVNNPVKFSRSDYLALHDLYKNEKYN